MTTSSEATCLFCKIARGEIPSHKVHEDGRTFAFLDIHPLAPGHVLVIPKRHAPLLEELSADDAGALLATARDVGARAMRATHATATTIALNNGKDAGQEVGHVHIHVVPRRAGDGFGPIHALFTKRPDVSPAELAKLAEAMRSS
ncbi:MAG: HIT family protein [Thermoplasmatota archaeon]